MGRKPRSLQHFRLNGFSLLLHAQSLLRKAFRLSVMIRNHHRHNNSTVSGWHPPLWEHGLQNAGA